MERIISDTKTDRHSGSLSEYEVQFISSIFNSSMSLAIREDEMDIYNALVKQNSCFLAELLDGDIFSYEENCFSELKDAAIHLLNIDVDYVVEQGFPFYLD